MDKHIKNDHSKRDFLGGSVAKRLHTSIAGSPRFDPWSRNAISHMLQLRLSTAEFKKKKRMIIGKWWRKRDRAREIKTVRERERRC